LTSARQAKILASHGGSIEYKDGKSNPYFARVQSAMGKILFKVFIKIRNK